MKKTLVAILAAVCLAMPFTVVSAQAQIQPKDPVYECTSEGFGQCVNNGSNAHGWEPFCYAPNNVLVTFAYYGHVNGQFPYVHYTQHFFYDDPPFWTIAAYDRDDSMSGVRVYWTMGGPNQDYPGENHLLYQINVTCEKPDGPKQKIDPFDDSNMTVKH